MLKTAQKKLQNSVAFTCMYHRIEIETSIWSDLKTIAKLPNPWRYRCGHKVRSFSSSCFSAQLPFYQNSDLNCFMSYFLFRI